MFSDLSALISPRRVAVIGFEDASMGSLVVARLNGLFCLVALVLLSGIGCGGGDQPELADVTGKVTLDGKPVVGVNVVFKPDIGRPAAAMTDAEGDFTLQYLDGVSGCKVGQNSVSFDWPPSAEDSAVQIPAKYSTPGSYKIEVKSGSNVINLPLTTN